MGNMILRLCLLASMLVLAPIINATTLSVSVDRNPIMVGETFTLTVTADFKTSANNLDHSALLKEFVVGSTSVGSNTRIVNGEISQQTTWNITLHQTNAGTYTIPAFEVNGTKSQPIEIKVIKQPTAGTKQGANEDVRLVTTFEHDQAFVGQQLLYQVKLYIGTSLQRAQLQAPSLQGAEITPLGEDSDSSEILDGRRYRVITRNYSIRPTQAGDFELTGSVFRGDISLSQRTSFFNNGRSKPVTIIADSKPFTVAPIPANFPGQWLVSAHVALEDKWSEKDQYIVGEPITRTITLTAADTIVEQLPELTPDFGPSFNTYPDKRTSQQGLNDTTLIAQAVQKFAVIPSQPGQFIIPEVKLAWFNSSTQQIAWASIPAKTISVIAGKQSNAAPIAAPAAAPLEKAQDTVVADQPLVGKTNEAGALVWWQLGCAVLSLLLFVCMAIIIKQRRGPARAAPAEPQRPPSLQLQLEKALRQEDSNVILKLMPMWLAKYHRIDISQLESVDSALASAYQALAKQQFGNAKVDVDFAMFTKRFSAFCKMRQEKNTAPLSGLYPKN